MSATINWAEIPLPQTPLGRVVTVDANEKVVDAVRKLHHAGILSAPVMASDAAADAPITTRCLGLVDVISLVMHMVEAFEAPSAIQEEDEEDTDTDSEPNFDRLPSEFAEQPLFELQDKLLAFEPVEASASLLDLATKLASTTARRVPVLSEDGTAVGNMVSQSSAVAQLLACKDKCGESLGRTLEQAGLADPKPVHTIRASAPVKEAFEIIRTKGISAVPVLSREGAMVGNISAEHIFFASVVKNKQYFLQLSASKFLEFVGVHGRRWDVKSSAITCRADDTLEAVMEKLSAAKIHRLYLTDDAQRPYRVVSLRDVLGALTAA